MKRALLLLIAIVTVVFALHVWLGYETTYELGYGAFTMMAAMISLTFLWLWAMRATPLALGMSFSWAGAASVMGWWWIFNLQDRPEMMMEHELLLACLSLYFAGAVLHFAVIERSFGRQSAYFLAPVFLSVAISALVRLIV